MRPNTTFLLALLVAIISVFIVSTARAGSTGTPLDAQSLAGNISLGLNGTSLDYDLSPHFNTDGTISYIGKHTFEDGNVTSFSINAKPDPSLVYGLVFGPTPGAGPHHYSFDFSQPFLGGPYDFIHQDFSGSATFGPPNSGGSITGITAQADINNAFVPGVALTGFSCSSGSNGSIACGQGSADSAIPSVSSPGTFSVHFAADLFDQATVGTFNGQVELSHTAVPEPSTMLLLITGLVLVYARRGTQFAL